MARRRQEALDAGQVIEQGNKTDNYTIIQCSDLLLITVDLFYS